MIMCVYAFGTLLQVRANSGLELVRVLQVLLEMSGPAPLALDTAVVNVGPHYPAQKFEMLCQDVQAAVDFTEEHQVNVLSWRDTCRA